MAYVQDNRWVAATIVMCCYLINYRLSVLDENKLSSNAFIGEICVSLKSLINRPVQRFKRMLEPQSGVSCFC